MRNGGQTVLMPIPWLCSVPVIMISMAGVGVSLVPTTSQAGEPTEQSAQLDGTGFATAVISGEASLLISFANSLGYPLTPEELKNILTQTLKEDGTIDIGAAKEEMQRRANKRRSTHSNAVVIVIDIGVDDSHPGQEDCTEKGLTDENGRGAHVAATVGGVGRTYQITNIKTLGDNLVPLDKIMEAIQQVMEQIGVSIGNVRITPSP